MHLSSFESKQIHIIKLARQIREKKKTDDEGRRKEDLIAVVVDGTFLLVGEGGHFLQELVANLALLV